MVACLVALSEGSGFGRRSSLVIAVVHLRPAILSILAGYHSSEKLKGVLKCVFLSSEVTLTGVSVSRGISCTPELNKYARNPCWKSIKCAK